VQSIHSAYGVEVVVGEGLGCRSRAYNADEEEEGGNERPGRIGTGGEPCNESSVCVYEFDDSREEYMSTTHYCR
jgi:hypothetical protein